jgi:SAM-dependent methyltransferase
MEASSYCYEDRVEADHWWFRGRRALFGRVLRSIPVASDSRVLDAGTSSGTNLRLLRDLRFTNYVGLELSAEAIALCRQKGLGPIERGDICNMPFAERSFAFVFATDVIEHVERDDLALSEIRRVLVPGGHCLVTVPAFPSLWGHQDIVSHHLRRYRRGPLLAAIKAAGLEPVRVYHFNYLLFLPIWCMRMLMRKFVKQPTNENKVNAPLLNAVLHAVFSLDVLTAPILRPPFGVSLLVLCRRPAEAGRP